MIKFSTLTTDTSCFWRKAVCTGPVNCDEQVNSHDYKLDEPAGGGDTSET